MVFKCKMCGGELQLGNNTNVAICPYCGTKQTIPTIDDDRKTRLYNRANEYRLNNEFDKAYGAYELIISEKEDESEAYWGLVLCDYGIEYVDDALTGKKTPTCHRLSYQGVFDNINFKKVLEFADESAKEIYIKEAEQFEFIRNNIVNVSLKEEPYDIFICYKETDENGNRTADSVIAQNVYNELTREGYKVFFSRITLENKLGTAYEPYIFAALNSAKVMLVIGTKAEHFNAVWVRNEWSRYLNLAKNSENKVIIPVYKDMGAYDLPEEFSYLQAQDMSKIGALQDLIYGIQKIAKPSKTNEPISQSSSVQTSSSLKKTKRKWKMFIAALLVLIIACTSALLVLRNSINKSKTSVVSVSENIIETKYFNMTIPEYWVGNYHVDMTGGSGYDTLTNEFEYTVTVYENSGYVRTGGGNLFAIILTSNPNYDSFADGGKIGEIMMDRQYYIFVRYPSDVQYDLDNHEIYTKMNADVQKVISSISSETYILNLYSQEDVDEPVNKQILHVESNGTKANVYLESWENSKWETVFSTEGTVAKNGVCAEIYEGSQRTPAGTFDLGFAFGVNPVDTKLEYRYVNQDTYWVDDPSSKFYNMWKNGVDNKDWNSAESLYPQFTKGKMRYCIVIEFNGNGLSAEGVRPGGGSVIFLCGRSGELGSTYGDVYIPEKDMITLLSFLDKSLNPIITIS